MDVLDADATIDGADDLVDFAAERGLIHGDRPVASRHRGVAAAIPAHRPAERHVQIERGAGLARNRLQPFGVDGRPDRWREMRRGGIAGVARQALLPVTSRKIWPHRPGFPRWTAAGA